MRGALFLAMMLLPLTAMAQREVKVANGETIPDLRACVDYVGRGALVSTGQPEFLYDPDDILGHSIYHYRFAERAELLGHSSWHTTVLARALHAPLPVAVRDAVVFLGNRDGRDRFIAWQWVWRDRRGRPFIPLTFWPDSESESGDRGWVPLALRNFARPVSYSYPQPYPITLPADDVTDYPDLFVKRGARVYVRYGLYLSELPAMFSAAAKAEDCWR